VAVLGVKTQPDAGAQLSLVQGLLSLQLTAVPLHTPLALHLSDAVQALPSEQLVPLGSGCSEQIPVAGAHVFAVHGPFGAVLHTTALLGFVTHVLLAKSHIGSPLQRLPSSAQSVSDSHSQESVPEHTPAAHLSPEVQGLPSLHDAVLKAYTQPDAGLHESVVQGLLSLQTRALPGAQFPAEQMSPTVQALPSLHAPGAATNAHPVAGRQVSVVHTFPSLQTRAGPAVQVPPAQVSLVVHALPSVQLPLCGAKTHPEAGLQESAVQGLLSVQTTGVAPAHVPAEHASCWVQALPSLHAPGTGVKVQPVAALQLSCVQGLLSPHSMATPLHVPPPQVSPPVHALPSLQATLMRLV
jgi:hypothetical protein